MLDAVNFLSKAWEEVTAETIRHSFRHAGLRSFANAEEEIEFENEDDTLSEWITQFNTPHTFTLEDLQNYVEIDENLVTTISLTDEEILNVVTKGEEEQKEDEEEAQPDEVVIPSIQQAFDAAKLLEKYLLFHEDDLQSYPKTWEKFIEKYKNSIGKIKNMYNNNNAFVDSHVGKYIFEHVIGPKGLLRNKTRILVIHGITYFKEVDLIVVMKEGQVSESGTYIELLDKRGDFADFLLLHMQEQNENEIDEKEINKLLEDAPADLKKKYVRQQSEINSNSSMQT
ncbi:hypothetical protein QTP88_015008 [Uroleucon formosanum]